MKHSCRCNDCQQSFAATVCTARYCPGCRSAHQGAATGRGGIPPKYRLTEEGAAYIRAHYNPHVKGRAQEIAAQFGWPAWAVRKHAARLGLSMGKPPDWTEAEAEFLRWNAGNRSVWWLHKHLPTPAALPRRTLTAVVLKLKRLQLSRRQQDGYTLRELCLCFGCDHKVIERWVREGKLTVRRWARHARAGWCVSDAEILRFIQAHPRAFDLRTVNQLWFMDLITDGGVIRKALASHEADESTEAA